MSTLSFLYNEDKIDKKLNKFRHEFNNLGLKSDLIEEIEEAIKTTTDRSKRIKAKLKLKSEYGFAINHHHELDIW
ncbi:hypothetical protein DBR28_00040 [Chryseobacterium sp. HMWF028]|nr:hypothetical protein DBR28_00040 [Chryseobacterium sp. HMWF028]